MCPGIALPHLQVLVQYAAGRLDGMPIVAPAGGVNHISSKSMSEAIAGALERGIGGKAYLVGDENLSWKAYLEMYFEAVGNPVDLEGVKRRASAVARYHSVCGAQCRHQL